MYLVYVNRVGLLKELLHSDEGKQIAKNDRDRQGNYMPHVAAAFDNLEVLQFLVEKGFNIFDLKNRNDETPLEVAINHKSQSILKFYEESKNRSKFSSNERESVEAK